MRQADGDEYSRDRRRFSPKWRNRRIGVGPYEKAPFTMRAYNGCRFLSGLSLDAALTWPDASCLIDLSLGFSHPSVISLNCSSEAAIWSLPTSQANADSHHAE